MTFGAPCQAWELNRAGIGEIPQGDPLGEGLKIIRSPSTFSPPMRCAIKGQRLFSVP